MPRSIVLPSIVAFSAVLASCGQQANPTSSQVPTPTVKPIVTVQPGIIYAETAETRLLTAQRADGLLDFKLYWERRATGQTTQVELPVPQNALVIGAALQDATHAFVATRTPSAQGDRDAIYALNLSTGQATIVVQSSPTQFAGIEINSLTAEDGTLRFFALHPVIMPNGTPESDLALFRVSDGMTQAVQIDSNTAEAAQFRQALKAAGARDLAAQRVTAQAITPFLRFPKTVPSYNYPGPTFHTEQDLYAVDLNRGTGDADLNDGVVAAAAGQVTQSSNVGTGYGEYITIRHSNGLTTAYAHLNKRVVSTSANVYQGQYIGNVGKSGDQPSAHLHFVLRSGTSPLHVASTNYPMAASYNGASCPITLFPDNIDVSPASC